MGDVLFIIIMIPIAIAAILIIPAYMTNSAMVKVVRIFRDQDATDVWSAKTAIQLGIGPRVFLIGSWIPGEITNR